MEKLFCKTQNSESSFPDQNNLPGFFVVDGAGKAVNEEEHRYILRSSQHEITFHEFLCPMVVNVIFEKETAQFLCQLVWFMKLVYEMPKKCIIFGTFGKNLGHLAKLLVFRFHMKFWYAVWCVYKNTIDEIY